LLDAFRDCPAMHRFRRYGSKDQKIERALHQIVRFRHTMIIYTINCRPS
jgi:hypothetical protein